MILLKLPDVYEDAKIPLKGGFSLSLPEFVILDSQGDPLALDKAQATILTALSLNAQVLDEDLTRLSKSYPSSICQLRKVLSKYNIKIHRLRRRGYECKWKAA